MKAKKTRYVKINNEIALKDYLNKREIKDASKKNTRRNRTSTSNK